MSGGECGGKLRKTVCWFGGIVGGSSGLSENLYSAFNAKSKRFGIALKRRVLFRIDSVAQD